jgi:hypothetical protein
VIFGLFQYWIKWILQVYFVQQVLLL